MVFMVATPTSTGAALAKAVELSYAPQWIGQSPTWIGALTGSPLMPYLEENFLVASEGVAWGDTSVPGMADLVLINDPYAPAPSPDLYLSEDLPLGNVFFSSFFFRFFPFFF